MSYEEKYKSLVDYFKTIENALDTLDKKYEAKEEIYQLTIRLLFRDLSLKIKSLEKTQSL